MGKLTDEWKQIKGTWFQKEIFERWVRYAEIPCAQCGNKFRTRHESETCSKRCMALYRWKNTPTSKRWRVKEGTTKEGYKMIHVPESGRLVYEHRYVIEKSIGRNLESSEQVHHRNGNKLDNRLENLVIITRADHNTLHKTDQAKKAKRTMEGRFSKH